MRVAFLRESAYWLIYLTTIDMKIQATIFSLLIILGLGSCKDEVVRTHTFHVMTPVSISVGDLRKQTLSVDKPHELSSPGKIYIYQNFLFINETRKGIHVVDNTDPASPRFINFINIPGNIDLAVNNNILYADSYVDLVAFDITNPTQIQLVKRVENVFDNQYIDVQKGIIRAFKDTVITRVSTNEVNELSKSEMTFSDSFGASASLGQSYGTGGSTARFTLMSENLYTVTENSLKLFILAGE